MENKASKYVTIEEEQNVLEFGFVNELKPKMINRQNKLSH